MSNRNGRAYRLALIDCLLRRGFLMETTAEGACRLSDNAHPKDREDLCALLDDCGLAELHRLSVPQGVPVANLPELTAPRAAENPRRLERLKRGRAVSEAPGEMVLFQKAPAWGQGAGSAIGALDRLFGEGVQRRRSHHVVLLRGPGLQPGAN